MRPYLECVPCGAQQAVEAARYLKLSDEVATRLLRRVLALLQEIDWRVPPPLTGRRIHGLIREELSNPDPYREQKLLATEQALALLPEVQRRIAAAESPFYEAVRLSIAGNVIDLGTAMGQDTTVQEVLDQALSASVDRAAVAELQEAIAAARSVLFMADNAGELVLDRPLLQRVGPDKVTVVVRGSPIINDATLEDAQRSGLTEQFRVISNGSDVPGTWLEECSDEVVRAFEAADVVVAKGQGNYETLSECPRAVFYLLRAKCSAVAQDLAVPVGGFVARRGAGRGRRR